MWPKQPSEVVSTDIFVVDKTCIFCGANKVLRADSVVISDADCRSNECEDGVEVSRCFEPGHARSHPSLC